MTTTLVGRTSARAAFIEPMCESLTAAGAEYVVLHGFGPDVISDSDIDIACSPTSRSVIETILRTAEFGPALQCLHYDVPWYRYYVLRSDEPGRRYRLAACDPGCAGGKAFGTVLELVGDRRARAWGVQ